MIMEAVKRNVCRGVIFLMACLTCVVVFGSGLIAEAAGANTPYAGGESYTALIFQKVWEDGEDDSSRPEKITFTVDLEDHNHGKSQAKKIEDVEITLTKEGNWTYTYVDDNENGKNYGYWYNSLKEPEVDGYEYVGENVEISQDIVTVTLTNRKKNDLTVTAAELGINGTKTLVGRDFRSGEIFTFVIKPQNGAPAPVDSDGKPLSQVTITPGSGSEAEIKFDGTFTFTATGTYAYQISEVKPEDPVDGMSYDPTVYQLTVEVKETQAAGAGSDQDSQTDGEGDDQTQTAGEKQGELAITNVKIEKSINGSDAWEKVYSGTKFPNAQYCNFINIYGASVDLTGTKMLEGREFQSDDTFTFTITPGKGAPAPVDDEGKRLTEVTIRPTSGEKSAEIDFGTIYFTPEVLGEGENPQTFTYTITEKQGNIDGMSYDTASRTVQIQVTAQEGGSMTAEVVSPVDGSLLWTNTWKDPGEPGGDPGGEPGDDPSDDSGDDPRPSYTSLTVNKEWILDDGGEAPASVIVELLRNNSVYDEVTLNEDNDWSHTWTHLNDRYNWKVREADVPDGFTAEVSHRGTIWTITNDDIPEDPETPPEEPDEPDEPDTPEEPGAPDEPGTPDEPDTPDEPGTPDGSDTPDEPTLPQTGQSWWPVWALAIAGAILMLAGILVKKRYHGKHEA